MIGKPLLRDSGQAKETICSGLAELGKEEAVAGYLLKSKLSLLRRGESGVVQGLGDEKGASTHPKNQYF